MALILGLSLSLAACGKKETTTEPAGGGSTGGAATTSEGASTTREKETQVQFKASDFELEMVTYKWDPQAGDPKVSAEDGGPGFTGEGWTTNMTFPARGSKAAVRGGTIRMWIDSWPNTLRLQGKDYNTTFNYRAVDLCQESLLEIHPVTLEFIPYLATHWKISDDKSTYTFRINPEAKWNDGRPVVADDVVATWKLLMDERLLMPSNATVFGKFEEPKALSKYIVEVKVKEESWRNLIYFSGMGIFPAHQISIPGDEYLREFQNKYTALSGPYTLKDEDVQLNQSLTLTRRNDWWAEGNPAYQGLFNFDAYQFTVIQDYTIAFERAKKGDLDFYVVPKAQWWAEELVPEKSEAVRRGLVQRRKWFNDAPVGTSGLALNMTRAPLDDVRVRKALALLRDRPSMIDKLFFDEYERLDSYWQYGDYRNPENGMTQYDPFAAVALLEEAGWIAGDDGFRYKDGKKLTLELSYRSKLSEPSLTIYKEDCEAAGIELQLQLLDPATAWKNLRQREFDIASTAWGALVFPNPETSWAGNLATVTDNNNVTAFSNARVDELLGVYDREYDPKKRSAIIREMDGIIFAEHPYVLDWYGPSHRMIYQNKFKMPTFGVWRTTDADEVMYCWWIDPEMEAKLMEAHADSSIVLPTEPIQHRYWEQWHKHQSKR
ncbi:MAG: extracellular solute-binding protein [Planctomycetota bacterium]